MKIKIEGGIYRKAASASYDAGKIHFFEGQLHQWDDYMPLALWTIEGEIPDVDTAPIEIAALKEKLTEINVKHHLAVQAIEGAINNLLAIDNNSSEAQ